VSVPDAARRPPLLAGLLKEPLGPLLDAAAVGDLLFRLAKGNVDLFRATVALLPPEVTAAVQRAMGAAAKRAQPQIARAPATPVGGLKLNMSGYT